MVHPLIPDRQVAPLVLLVHTLGQAGAHFLMPVQTHHPVLLQIQILDQILAHPLIQALILVLVVDLMLGLMEDQTLVPLPQIVTPLVVLVQPLHMVLMVHPMVLLVRICTIHTL